MINLNNIDTNNTELAGKLAQIAYSFEETQWEHFIGIYKEPEKSDITKSLANIRQALKADPIDLQNLQKVFNELPGYQRIHFEPALIDAAKKQDLNITSTPDENIKVNENLGIGYRVESKIASSPTPLKSQSLHIHFQGTEVGTKGRAYNDYIAEQVREQDNFYIQSGVSRYTGGEGRAYIENIIEHIRNNRPTNNRIVLTGFSRGAAAQIFLANRIHEEFNKEKSKENWIKIDMFLVDPGFGTADSTEYAGTREHVIPKCVNTLNIVYANPLTTVQWLTLLFSKLWFQASPFFTRKTAHELISDPKYTTINTMSVQGGHNDVGLMNRDLTKRKSSYVVDALCRIFLKCVGSNQTQENLDAHLDKSYIQNNMCVATQAYQPYVMQYHSSYATRLNQEHISKADANGILVSKTMSTYLPMPDPSQQDAHNRVMQIFDAIITGDYQTRYGRGVEYEHRLQSKLPKHMYAMCERIEKYCNDLKAGQNPQATAVLADIQNIAKEASNSLGIGRQPEVTQFYSSLKAGTSAENVTSATEQLKKPPAP